MNLGHYRARYGELPLANLAAVGAIDKRSALRDEDAKRLADGMETLAGVLVLAMGLEDDVDAQVH